MKQEFETPGSPIAVPYKWEASPGRPIVQAAPAPLLEPWMSPLRPPPGPRKATKSLASAAAFRGFEPERPVVATLEQQLGEKILKKLNRLRRKSMVAAMSFTSEALRVIEHNGRLFTVEDTNESSAYDLDYDTMSSVSTLEQPGTPCSSTSFESSFSEPNFSSRSSTHISSSPYITRARPSSCRFEEVDLYSGHDNGSETLPGPRESAWHQQSGELAMDQRPPLPPKTPSIRRSYSSLIPTILRQSSSARSSFKQLALGRTFRRSKAAKQLELGNLTS